MHAIARIGSCGEAAHLFRVRELVEKRGRHLRPAGAVYACEDDRIHEASLRARAGTIRCGATSHRKRAVAVAAPRSCAATNAGTSAGRMPANVSLAARASVTAGFANEVDAVNQ
jgi:hypothetical protein